MTQIYQLKSLSSLMVSGRDASSFLQGQLSTDLNDLEPKSVQITSLSNPKGRVVTLAYLTPWDDGVLMILPQELTGDLSKHLQKYVLRADVSLTPHYAEIGVRTAPEGELTPSTEVRNLDKAVQFLIKSGDRAWGSRVEADEGWWLDYQIQQGLPWVSRDTSEQFVAQMLNLDLLNGISWTKGCYTGQEIIARTYYRGKNKRRMLPFTSADIPLKPGDTLSAGESLVGTVVIAHSSAGSTRGLAVFQLSALEQEIRVTGTDKLVTLAQPPYLLPELDT